MTVIYLGSSSGLENKIIEKAEFVLIIVPEFPLGVAIVMTTMVAALIVLTRFKINNYTKLK